MTRSMIKIATLVATTTLASAALAQVVTKPRVEAPGRVEVLRPGNTKVEAEANKGADLSLKSKTPGIGLSANSQEQAPSCSLEQLASDLIKDTHISYADALAALKFWGARISVGTCGKDAQGLIGFGPEARENFLQAAITGMIKLQGLRDYSGVSLSQTWAEALASAKNDDANAVQTLASAINDDANAVQTTAAAELATVRALGDNCKILNLGGK